MNPDARTFRVALVDSDSGFEHVLTKRMEAAAWEHRVHAGAIPVSELIALKLTALIVNPAVIGERWWEFLEETCDALPGLGVLVVAQQSTVVQRTRGLRIGADDWMQKPCHPEEVVARVEAIARRHRYGSPRLERSRLVVGELEIRPDQYQAFAGGRSLELTRREFELLSVLAQARGLVVEREDIYQRVWGYAMAHGDRSVDVFVRKLRQKLSRVSEDWEYIHTHFGIGYRLDPDPTPGHAPTPAPPVPHPAEASEADTSSHAFHTWATCR